MDSTLSGKLQLVSVVLRFFNLQKHNGHKILQVLLLLSRIFIFCCCFLYALSRMINGSDVAQ
jgi:hypothetical protein